MKSEIYSNKLKTVCNAVIQIGDIDDTGKGRHFVSKFIQDGLVKIEGHGIVLLKKETIDQSLQSMVGAPVIIKHQDVTNENADELRCGVISKAYFNDFDGWYYCEGIIWDEKAKELVNNGWSVSCSYDFLAYNDEGGVENNIKYDKEFTQLNFTHLALVDNPRYERANIVFNCKTDKKGQDKMILNALKDFISHIENERDSEFGSDKGKWVIINGNHIFIRDGQTLGDAMDERGWGDKGKSSNFDKKYSEIEKIIKAKNWEPLEEESALEELEDYKREFKKNLEPRQEEALLEKLEDYKTDILDKYPKFNNPSEYKQSDSENKHGFKKDKDSGYYMKDLSDGTSVYVEKKEGGQGEKEPFYLEATYFDKDGKTIAKKQYHYDSMDGMFSKIDKDFVSKDINNSKEQDMALLEELKKLIFKVENEKGEQDMDEKEKVDNENVDKRKLIDEVAGIMKSAGCDDEDIRTAIGKMEKIGYDKSEAGSADNKKVKNEEPDKKEDKKEGKEVDNEDAEDKKEAEDLKEDAKEDVKNKCKNSKSSFDKINEIYNSVKQIEKETGYVSRQQKLDNAVEYFK